MFIKLPPRFVSIFFLGIVVSLFFAPEGVYATNVSGNQWGTWNIDGSPYVVVGNVTVPKCDPLITDHDDDGVWDDAEEFDDWGEDGIPNTSDSGEGNEAYDLGEPFEDRNDNGHWDPAELFNDLNGDGNWTSSYSLTIDPGVEVVDSNQVYNLLVSGSLDAEAIISSLRSITYSSGSNGSIVNSDLGSALVTLSSSFVTLSGNTLSYVTITEGVPVVSGNDFTDDIPIRITDPNLNTDNISGNNYLHSDPWISWGGTLAASKTLSAIDGLE